MSASAAKVAVVAATRLRSHAPLIAMAVFRTVFVAVGIGLIYLDAVDKSAWRATMALHVSFTAIPFLSDGSFNYLNAALEGVVPRRDYGNGNGHHRHRGRRARASPS